MLRSGLFVYGSHARMFVSRARLWHLRRSRVCAKMKCKKKNGTFHVYYPPSIVCCSFVFVCSQLCVGNRMQPVCYCMLHSLTREILVLPLKHKIHIFSPPCNILYVCMYLYVTRMYSISVLVCNSYIFVCHSCVLALVLVFPHMYSYVFVCHSYVLVCTRMYPYVTRMSPINRGVL